MSQPKRRSRKSKLVPRSTEGGEPEIKEVSKMEESGIKISNPMSLAEPASKKSSIQFKVDIEVEEWIDDELFIEENFAKMQSEQRSQASDRDVKEEVDWTNDEYGKIWAEANSDGEDSLNEYAKLIKNQVDPSLVPGRSLIATPRVTAGPSNAKPYVKTPVTENIVVDEKQIPKPRLKIKQPEKLMSKKRKTETTTELVPQLKINVVFEPKIDSDVTKNPGLEDKTRKADGEEKPREQSERVVSYDELLNKTVYFIDFDKDSEETTNKGLEQVVVSLGRMLVWANKLFRAQQDPVDRMLNIELRNRIGRNRFVPLKITRQEALINYALRQWAYWHRGRKAVTVPLLYKCYICNEGWWHLEPFRNHIQNHKYLEVVLEKHNLECNIIAFFAKPVKYRMFPIDDECPKCGNGYAHHMGVEECPYKCKGCHVSLGTCTGLAQHEGICLSIWKEQMVIQSVKDVKAYKCKICPQLFFTSQKLLRHQYLSHVPRSDRPMLFTTSQCVSCNEDFNLQSYHYCKKKIQKYICEYCLQHFPSSTACNLHVEASKRCYMICPFCPKKIYQECLLADHLVTHTKNYLMMYKCMRCPDLVMHKSIASMIRHIHYMHYNVKEPNCYSKLVVPLCCYNNHKVIIDHGSQDTQREKRKKYTTLINETKELQLAADEGKSQKEVTINNADEIKSTSNQEVLIQDAPVVAEIKPEDMEIVIKQENETDDETSMDIEPERIQLFSYADESSIKIEAISEIDPEDLLKVNIIQTDEENIVVKEEPIEYDDASTHNFETDIEINFVCTECDFEGDNSEYKKHKKVCKPRINNGAKRCTKCNVTFRNMKEYVRHLPAHGFSWCECKECDKMFISLSYWVNHVNLHVKNTFFKVNLLSRSVNKCSVCKDVVRNDEFFEHWELHLHEKAEDVADIEPEGALSRATILDIIDMLQTNICSKLPKNCVVCDRHFTRKNEKKRHLVEHLLQDAHLALDKNKALLCPICRDSFARDDEFRRHMRDHSGVTVYQCEYCDKTFSDSSNFVKHKKVHNIKGMACICDLCNKKFLSKSSLAAHIAQHTPVPLKCVQCVDKYFYSESAYRRHIRILHDKSLGYKCFVCRKRFNTLKCKWDHQWEAHRIRQHAADCTVCGMQFRKRSDVTRHMQDEHSEVAALSKNH